MTSAEFQRIWRLLYQEAHRLRCPVKIHRFRRGRRTAGSYNTLRPQIKLYYGPQSSYLQRLAAFAHEIRHAQHHQQGRWPNYYHPRWMKSPGEIIVAYYGVPARQRLKYEYGLAAENDCNAYARKFLKAQGHPLPKNQSFRSYWKYPGQATLSYHVLVLIAEFQVAQEKILKKFPGSKIGVTYEGKAVIVK